MKIKFASILVCSVMLLAAAVAQTNTVPPFNQLIVGHGKQGFVPRFLGPQKVGDSNIFQSADGNIGVGTATPIYPVHVFGTNVIPPAGQCCPVTSFVENSGSANGTTVIALEGLASAGSGTVQGVNGTTFSPGGNGVFGNNTASTGGGGGGVIGITDSADFGFSYAVRGSAPATTGSAIAFFGESFSSGGTAGYFLNRAGGNIIVGHVGQNDDQSVFRVDGTGRVFADGGFQPNGADFSESMTVTGSRTRYAAGDLLVIDPSATRQLGLAQQPYSTLVAGIYSTRAGNAGQHSQNR